MKTERCFYWFALSANALGILFNTAVHNWSSASLCGGMLILIVQNPPAVPVKGSRE